MPAREQLSLMEFQARFPDEEACRLWLERRRWPDGFVCPRCAGRRSSYVSTRRDHECLDCRYQVSLTAGTIFHKTRVPLHKWLWMMYWLALHKKPPSILQMQRDLAIGSYKTAWRMSHAIRLAMTDQARRDVLGGTVELDDAYFGGAAPGGPGGRGAARKKAVVVGVSKESADGGPRRVAFEVAAQIDGDAIDALSRRQIAAGSRVVTDALAANRAVARRGDVEHAPVAIGGDRGRQRRHLGWVHILISNAKRLILGTHHSVGGQHLAGYLGEFAWRFNRRRADLFGLLTRACLGHGPVPLASLLAPEGLSGLME